MSRTARSRSCTYEVFDGADLPMKADTHNERRERREEAMRKAEQAFAVGDRKKAEEWYQRAYTVTSEMARLVIRECRKINVEYVVAPYEADAQLAWMMKIGYIDGVITEDSDMLVYGASKILFKMNRFGNGDLFESRNLLSLDSLNMSNFTEDMFLYMSVCSGCDFFKGVQGLGVKKSHAVVKRFRTMTRLILAIRQDRRYKVLKSFPTDFARACLVFRHQTVFDMRTSQHVHLNEFDDEARAKLPQGVLSTNEDGSLDLSFLGTHRDTATAKKIALGHIHPRSLEEYMDPLDSIARPVTNRVRPSRFPSPPRRRRVESNETRNVRGFQVQPASLDRRTSGSCQPSGTNQLSRSSGARYASSLSLRQRLASRNTGPQTFNPRRAGAAFRAKHGSVPGSSGIWASFKSSRDCLRSDREPSRLETSGLNDNVPTVDDDSLQVVTREDGQANRKENSPPEDSLAGSAPRGHSPEPQNEDDQEFSEPLVPELPERTHDEDPEQQQDFEPAEGSKPRDVLSALDAVQSPKPLRVTSSRRVEAVKRAIGRFAQTEKKDVAKKFVSTQKPVPNPEEDKYDLLADRDVVLARPEETRNPSPKNGVKSQPAKKLQRGQKTKAVSQVRLSRFFPPRKQSQKEGTQNETATNSVTPLRGTRLNRAKLKLGIQKVRKKVGPSSLSKLKRGAVGKTAMARRTRA